MSEVLLLMKKARRYLRSAKLLLEEGDYESSASRTYYAMFYSAQAMLFTKGLSFSSHKGVISAFGEYFVKTGIFPKEMGKELNKAFSKRQISDYDVFAVTKEDAEELLKSGRKFVNAIATKLK